MPPNDPALPISIILYQLLKILKPLTSNYCYPLILEYQLINFHTQLILKNKMINKESLEQLTLFPALLILFNVWNKISFYIYVIKSMSFNILQETDSIVSCANSRAKLHFLQAEKSRLETIIGQMEQQIHLQRHINQELSKANGLNENEVMGSLMTQNKRLQQQYLRIKKENEQLSSTLLIHEQLMNENQQEFATSFRSFEEKIIQLRRSIQFKESYIQNMEEKYKQAQERIIVPSNNVTLLFFNEIEQLKKTISNLSFKNKELEYQNKTLLSKIEQSEKQLKLLESLSLKSKLTYEEMKNYYNIQKVRKRNSAPKKETYIPLNEKLKQLSMKKLNQAQTRQCSQYYISTVNAPTKMLLYKYIQQIQKLKDELLKLANKVAIEQESKGKILRSYIQQQRKLQQMALQLRYYKQSTKDLLDMIAYKRHNKHSVSHQKTKQERTIDKISVPKVYKEDNQNHKLWKSMKCEVKIQKIRLLQIKRKYQGFYRSFSSTLDYRTMKLDEFNKNVNRRSPYKPKERNNQRFNINQFSMMIDNPSLDNISFIQMHKGRKNFAEWKKETKKQSLLHLTVIEENIL